MKVTVYLGAQTGNDCAVEDSVVRLGQLIVEQRLTLVYGGSGIGLMGRLADTVMVGQGKVEGIITRQLLAVEPSHPQVTDLQVVETMQERKLEMERRADFFIMMPGGLGTVEELTDVWNGAKIGRHQKPIGVLNINGYYDLMLAFFDHAVVTGFLKQVHRDLLVVESDVNILLHKLNASAQWRLEQESAGKLQGATFRF